MKTFLHKSWPIALSLGALALLAWHCAPGSAERPAAFYYWRSDGDFPQAERERAERLGLSRFYLRCFDVDWSEGYGMNIPRGDVSRWGLSELAAGFELVPVVYLTNRSMEQSGTAGAEALAEKVWARMSQSVKAIFRGAAQSLVPYDAYPDHEAYEAAVDKTADSLWQAMPEIQLDCDWTASTRDAYFAFVEAMKRLSQRELSCTIRLYPFKYQSEMGVPPADRGVLMCYNASPVNDPAQPNSIFDWADVKAYLGEADYPLPLDVALPLFSWGAWFRGEQFQGLLRGLSAQEVAGNARVFAHEGGQRYRVSTDAVIAGQYLREGDVLRFEQADIAGLQKLRDWANGQKSLKKARFVYFDWNPQHLDHYGDAAIQALHGAGR